MIIEGDFEEDNKHGTIIETNVDGSRCEGLYKDDKKDGQWREIDKDANIKECLYENGELISSTKLGEIIN
jgi:hypothetical protein